MKISTTSTENN